MISDILEAVIFKFRGFERKADFRTRHRWSEWNFRRHMTNYGLDPFHATNNHEKQITWNVPHSPPPQLYKEMKSERLWFWSFILLCLSLFLISLFDTAIIVFCRFCDIIMCFVLSDDIDYKRGFKNTYTHALTHARTGVHTHARTHTRIHTHTHTHNSALLTFFSLTCDVQTLQTINKMYTKWQSNYRFSRGTAKCLIMNVSNPAHDYAGDVHMGSHPTNCLQTDPHDPFGLYKSHINYSTPKIYSQPTSSRGPLTINHRTVGYEVCSSEPRSQTWY